MATNWVHALSECLAAIEREQIGSVCPVVDHEVIRSADGGPDDMTAWLICRNKAEQRQFADGEFMRAVSALRKHTSTRDTSACGLKRVEAA
jgi:hypothetical protein